MSAGTVAGIVYAVVTIGAMAFQVALALGAPLGEYAMGGRFPGRFSPALRVGAAVQALVLGCLAAVVLSRAGVALPHLSQSAPWLIWVVVAFAGLSTLLNAATRSTKERAIWFPVAIVLLLSSLIVGLAG